MTVPFVSWPGSRVSSRVDGYRHACLALVLLMSTMGLASPAPAATKAELDAVRTQVRQGALSQALVEVDRLLKRLPDDPQLRFLKGVVLAESDQVDEAIRVFSSITQDFPDLPEPHNNLAVLYASKGDYENARDALLVAINTHPSYATAHENLGDIYAKMARLAYDRALSLNTANRTAQAKLNLLRELFSVRGAAETDTRSAAAEQPVGTARPSSSPAGEVQSGGRTAGPATDSGAVVSLVQNWADSWSRQDVAAYLGFYDDSFRPTSGESRARWAARRASRLQRPRFIQVTVDDFDVQSGVAGRFAVTFTQRYQSDTYEDSVRKQLVLVVRPEGLRIVAERTIP